MDNTALDYYLNLIEAGVKDAEARTQVKALATALEVVATKEDIQRLDADMKEVKSDVKEIKGKIEGIKQKQKTPAKNKRRQIDLSQKNRDKK